MIGMNLFKSFSIRINTKSIRFKHDFVLKESVAEIFESGKKYRHHPGRRHLFTKDLPYKLKYTATSVINRYRDKHFRQAVKRINDEFLRIFISENNTNIDSLRNIKVDKSFDCETYEKNEENIRAQQKDRSQYFKKEFYNHQECASYMAARLPANYAAVSYVFNEIKCEEPEFIPSTVFDFGSGIGTTIWAADQFWDDSIKEYFCVDINENMNELSRELLRKGVSNNENVLDRVFYRQFLPAKHLPSYDLVVSAFSLLEMEDTRSRIYVVENLWHKTSGALVLIEHGSKAGFAAIMEARNFLLQINRSQIDYSQMISQPSCSAITDRLSHVSGSIMAPCPHDLVCPRQTNLNKKSYCNFKVNYQQLDYGQENPGIKEEKFTFLVFKKNGIFQWKELQKKWPKVVEPIVKNSGHNVCRICDNDGTLKQVIASKSKTPRHVYNCMKKSKWGDKLPIEIKEIDKS